MQTLESIFQTQNRRTTFARPQCAAVLLTALLHLPAAAATPPPETTSQKTIPWTEVGAAAGAQYSGDGLSVTPTRDGARLRCVFQRMQGEATREGLWLSSTVTNRASDRFRVAAIAYGRAGSPLPADGAHGVTRPTQLPGTGNVSVDGQTVRFTRPGLVEEYSVSMDGVRQDFIIAERPRIPTFSPSDGERVAKPSEGMLRIELAVTGARVEPTAHGAQLMLEHSGRKIAYSRLKVTDATGRELPARMELLGSAAAPAAPVNASLSGRMRDLDLFDEVVEQDTRGTCAAQLAILVDDADAVYPVRIDPTFSDANWISMGGIPGANSRVSAAVADDSGNLYIGGEFTIVGDVVANRIAKWDGNRWSALGSGMNGWVQALAVSGSDLYAGGQFTTAGGVAATNIAKWNGSSWSAVGSGITAPAGAPYYYGVVRALAVSGSDLYAGGRFTTAGGVLATNVAKWNGSSWSALGSGITAPATPPYYNGSVWALAVSGGDLYAGGEFTAAGGVSATNIAKWNGGNWSALGSGITSPAGDPEYSRGVYALAVWDSDLYAGGRFTAAGGVSATNIAKWNGISWSALGPGLGVGDFHSVYALAVFGSELYAGGYFWRADGTSPSWIAKWNGSSWSLVGSGMLESVFALAVSGNDLYAGGDFTTAGGVPALRIAKWNGNTWSALSPWINGGVSALAVSGGDLYAGGEFTTAGGIVLNRIGKWNGSSWTALGSGMNGYVYALAVSGSEVYAGGAFTNAGGVTANRIAKWNGSNWSALGSGISGRIGGGDPVVSALPVSGANLYAGGDFTTAGGVPATNIAKWDGSSWSPLGSGIGGPISWVSALAVSDSDLYAGGHFMTAGGVPANGIAKWNGTSWSALGLGVDGPIPFYVSALAVSGSDLYAGGSFVTAGGVPATNIAKWNGSTWSALGSGIYGVWELGAHVDEYPGVCALALSGNNLYAGGWFTTAGGIAASCIAKWNGSSWSALGSGTSGVVDKGEYTESTGVSALAVLGSDLYAGGSFTSAAGKVSAYLAKAIINPPVLNLERNASGTNFIRFSGVPGTPYHLQRALSLAGPWPNIATNTAPANGRIEVGDGSPPPDRAFYRVVEP